MDFPCLRGQYHRTAGFAGMTAITELALSDVWVKFDKTVRQILIFNMIVTANKIKSFCSSITTSWIFVLSVITSIA